MDAVIHNAGVYDGPAVLPVNVVAPYVLTASMHGPERLVYLSSGMHRGGAALARRVQQRGGSRLGPDADGWPQRARRPPPRPPHAGVAGDPATIRTL